MLIGEKNIIVFYNLEKEGVDAILVRKSFLEIKKKLADYRKEDVK